MISVFLRWRTASTGNIRAKMADGSVFHSKFRQDDVFCFVLFCCDFFFKNRILDNKNTTQQPFSAASWKTQGIISLLWLLEILWVKASEHKDERSVEMKSFADTPSSVIFLQAALELAAKLEINVWLVSPSNHSSDSLLKCIICLYILWPNFPSDINESMAKKPPSYWSFPGPSPSVSRVCGAEPSVLGSG